MSRDVLYRHRNLVGSRPWRMTQGRKRMRIHPGSRAHQNTTVDECRRGGREDAAFKVVAFRRSWPGPGPES